MSILRVDGLVKSYGDVMALQGIDLEVGQGEVYGFIGPNGAGKTTTIRVMLGVLKPDSGKVKIFGQDAWKDAVDIHKRIAYVPGEVSLWPNLTGGEVIDLFVKLRGSNHESLREELIERFELDPSKKCGTYSKGNRQKVALIAAFAAKADLYILDEPTSGLDPLMERVFQECIREIKKEGKSVFLSSHILSEVERLCDKISIIRQGRIIESGTLNDLRHLTRTQIVAETKNNAKELNSLQGIYDLVIDSNKYRLQVESAELGKVIKYLSQYEIVSFESSPPKLEDLFMHHYSGAGSDD